MGVTDVRVEGCAQAAGDGPSEGAVDRQAFTDLYRSHVDSIYRYMRYQVCSEEAHDLTAQVFLKAFRAGTQFRGESSYRTWLFRIAHNTVVSWRRGCARQPVPVPDLPEVVDGAGDAAQITADAETSILLWGLVQELSDPERELVQLRFVEGMAPREIAEATGVAPGAIRVRLHRLLRRLRRRLEETGVER